MDLMRKSRIGFYATPGIDGGEIRTKGFNQVTPRFLELLSCECHVIARYKNNPDTDYYELSKFSTNINSYETFENTMNWARNNPIDKNKYVEYLEKHYTSERVQLLKMILEQN
jgi:hypothetical protein